MEAIIVGKKGGIFTGKDGKEVKSYKINFICPYEDEKRTGYYHVGNAVFERKCSYTTFVSLPDDEDPYIEGIPCDISFDINGNVDKVKCDGDI